MGIVITSQVRTYVLQLNRVGSAPPAGLTGQRRSRKLSRIVTEMSGVRGTPMQCAGSAQLAACGALVARPNSIARVGEIHFGSCVLLSPRVEKNLRARAKTAWGQYLRH